MILDESLRLRWPTLASTKDAQIHSQAIVIKLVEESKRGKSRCADLSKQLLNFSEHGCKNGRAFHAFNRPLFLITRHFVVAKVRFNPNTDN